MREIAIVALAFGITWFGGVPSLALDKPKPESRKTIITRSKVWLPIDTGALDLKIRECTRLFAASCATNGRSGFPTVDEWVTAFKDKRRQIAEQRCPS